MAAELSDTDRGEAERIRRLIAAAGLPGRPPKIAAEKLRAAMDVDKKVRTKQVRFVLLKSIGDAYVTTHYSEATLSRILQNS
jgi:3-dehydroquinate synthase